MSAEEFELLVNDALKDRINLHGEVLYSGKDSLKKGDIYFIGTNPSGDKKFTIKEDINLLKERKTNYNEYLDGKWTNENSKADIIKKDNLQKKVKTLFGKINYDLRDVCSSNLIFFTAKDLTRLKPIFNMNFKELADICWPVHERLLSLVQPKVVIAYGNSESNSPFNYMQKKFKITNEHIKTIPTGHGGNCAKYFDVDNSTYFFLPHLSRFRITNDEIYDFLKGKLNR